MTDTAELDGKVAIVTGAGQGMGKDAAMRLASNGARVVVNDVNAEAVEQTVADIETAGGAAHCSATVSLRGLLHALSPLSCAASLAR